jgi:hypothetical protein
LQWALVSLGVVQLQASKQAGLRVRQEDRGQNQEQQEQQGGLGLVEAMVAMLAGVGEGGAMVVGSDMGTWEQGSGISRRARPAGPMHPRANDGEGGAHTLNSAKCPDTIRMRSQGGGQRTHEVGAAWGSALDRRSHGPYY